MRDATVQFVLEQAARQPVRERITIYRDLAEALTSENNTVREELRQLADELEQTEQHTRQILFNFNLRNL